MAVKKSKTDRKLIRVATRSLNFRHLHGKTVQEVIEHIESIRQELLEYEFLYNYKVTLNAESRWSSDARFIVERFETDAEYNKRIERNRRARETRLKNITAKQKQQEEKERKLYEALKQKYG